VQPLFEIIPNGGCGNSYPRLKIDGFPYHIFMKLFISPNISEHIFSDHLILLNHSTNQVLVLNPSARLIWKWFSQGYDNTQVIIQLSEFFKIPYSVAKQDVKKLWDHWHQNKLLIRSIEPAIPLISKKNNNLSTAKQTLNIRKIYLMANIPFSLSYNNKNKLANHIHSLFAHIEIHDQQSLKNFILIKKKQKHILMADDEELFSDSLFANVKGYLINEILKLSYPNKEWLAMMHAMAVVYEGKSIIMSAPSGYGKSTLTAALLKEGYSYLGDDLIPIQRSNHHITPLPTSLSIKKGSWSVLNSRYPELNESDIYNSRGRHVRYLNPSKYIKTELNLPVTALIFSQYKAQQNTILKPISKIEALQRLLENEIWLGHPLKNDVLSEFLTWLNKIPVFSFSYSQLDQAVKKISELFNRL